MTEIWEMSAAELLRGYLDGGLSPVDAVDACFGRIESLNDRLGAFTVVTAERARAEALERTTELAAGDLRGPLHGIPIAVKELFDLAGVETTYGSDVFCGHIPERDAFAVAALRKAGAIVLGLTRTHEFAWGITTVHETRGAARNPYATDRIAGGSSGGSAVAVATGMAPLALGSDTGGSIRIPAALCGITGIKPSFGSIDTSGVCPLAPTLDHIGTLARTVEDAAEALSLISDIRVPQWRDDLLDVTVVCAPDLHVVGPQSDHLTVFGDALAVIEDLGATLEERGYSGAETIYSVYSTLQGHEAYEAHTDLLGTFPNRIADYSTAARGNLEIASEISDADFIEAVAERLRIRERFHALLRDADVLVTLVAGGPPSTVARPDTGTLEGADISFRNLVLPYTVPQDMTGFPAVAVRAGTDDLGIPVGIQFTALQGRDDLAMIAARAFQRAVPSGWPSIH
ncbi:MAG: Asp-tRNA(Asn)/Glu-tRNA(Gln) amidotransferase GatCAB subunit A [Actinobacteria bacterium]|nr:Asp-tRNA(Asn)/Glu-tRNA(Gln) amidotransferase GatCAB subunit A [Actinomycetota bacterium]